MAKPKMDTVLPLSKSPAAANAGSLTSTNDSSEYQGARVRRHHDQHHHPPDIFRKSSSSQDEFSASSPPTPPTSHAQSQHKRSQYLLLGLTIAGVASTLLTTIFGLFHVDVFLNAYELPLASYSRGNFIFSIVNTINDLVGAWIVDHASATTMERTDMVGAAGCIFCVCFLTPFFRWRRNAADRPLWENTFHFVVSMSLYDTLYSFTAILMGSIVTDDHTMSDLKRQQFMASGKVWNLLASFAVARMGLTLFDVQDLHLFRRFLVALALVAAVLFVGGQTLIRGVPVSLQQLVSRIRSGGRLRSAQHWKGGIKQTRSNSEEFPSNEDPTHTLHLKKVATDFWRHKNFKFWVVMEMLLEAQVTFNSFFLKTFVDSLVLEDNVSGGFSRETCDWFLSIARPMIQVAAIFAYIPINRFGYHRLYKALFVANMVLGIFMLLFASPQSPSTVLLFLTIYIVITGAVQSAGFHLAMADMVLEMKQMHAVEGRTAEPSLAGLFMGTNAVFCKPMESLLPVIAASVMERTASSDHSLFNLLAAPPIVFSLVQFLAWSQYSLTPSRTASMRYELQQLKQEATKADGIFVHLAED